MMVEIDLETLEGLLSSLYAEIGNVKREVVLIELNEAFRDLGAIFSSRIYTIDDDVRKKIIAVDISKARVEVLEKASEKVSDKISEILKSYDDSQKETKKK